MWSLPRVLGPVAARCCSSAGRVARITNATRFTRWTTRPDVEQLSGGDVDDLGRPQLPAPQRVPNDSTESRSRWPHDRARTISSLWSSGRFGGLGARVFITGEVVWPVVVVSVLGPGGDFAEEPVFRCEPVTQATEPFLECPARARCSAGGALCVGDEMAPDDVAEPTLERPDRFAWGLAFGERRRSRR